MAVRAVGPKTSCKPLQREMRKWGRDFGLNARDSPVKSGNREFRAGSVPRI
jgi:hypothetical protein